MTKSRAIRILKSNLAEAIAEGDVDREFMIVQRLAEWGSMPTGYDTERAHRQMIKK